MTIQKDDLELKKCADLCLITQNMTSRIDKVKFVLFCAKDCFHLNNEHTKSLATTCIQLIESWLIDHNSVTAKQLFDAANVIYRAAYANGYPSHAAAAAYAAIYYTAHKISSPPLAAIYYFSNAAYNASFAFYFAHYNDQIIQQQKRIQYQHYAYSLLRSTNIIPIQTKGKISDKATLMALLDELSELNENLIIHKDDKVTLNHPDNITTTTLPELVDTIWNDASLLHYLEHLYGNHIA